MGILSWILFGLIAGALGKLIDLEDSTKHVLTLGPILPARELLGEMLLELNQPQQALNEFETVLKDSPNRLNALAGAARAAELSGRKEQARNYYLEIEESCKNASGERQSFDRSLGKC